jgi:gamma-glutamylputrescine oxidase
VAARLTPPAWDLHPEVAAWPGLPPLAADATADLCVVGLGGSGLAAVDWAVERGLDVVGVDAGRVGAGAAGRNGGFLLGGGARFHHDAVAHWGRPAAAEMHRLTLAEIDRLHRRVGPDVVARTGSLRLAGLPGSPDADEVADCERHLAALHADGFAAEWYDGPLGVGVHLPDDAAMHPALRCVREASRLIGRATLHEQTPVTGFGRSGRRVHVRTPVGVIATSAVVVCVDGGLERLLPQLAGRVRTTRLQMLATEPVAPVLDRPLYARHGYDYAQQLPTGELLVGGGRDRFADDEWTTDCAPTSPVQAHIEQVAARIAGGPVRVTHRWAGLVGFATDGRPVCELVDDCVAAAGGYDGTGNLVGPLAARAAAALAVGADPEPWPL